MCAKQQHPQLCAAWVVGGGAISRHSYTICVRVELRRARFCYATRTLGARVFVEYHKFERVGRHMNVG